MYNLHVAPSITFQAKSCICTAGLLFEAFLANNVKFENLNEIVTFIDNIHQEKNERTFYDYNILDENIDVDKCYAQIILTCGWNYIPDKNDMDIIYDILNNLNQEELNRIYYKNNLYEFLENRHVCNALMSILRKLESPYLDPNKAPKEAHDEIEYFKSLLMEYVYYHHQYIDRMDRYQNMCRSVACITD